MKQKATLTLTMITDPVTGNGTKGPWSKRTFVFTSGTDTIPMIAWNMDGEMPPTGHAYDVEYYINGREYNGNYYVDLKLDNITHTERPAVPELLPNGTAVQPHLLPPTTANQAVQRSRQRSEQLAATQENDLPF